MTRSQRNMADIAMLTLANHAEVQNGLLYMSGAEWDTVTRTYPQGGQAKPQHLAIALSVVVPWLEANTPLAVSIRMEDEDGQTRLLEAGLDLEVGRPPGKPHGSDSRSAVAFTGEVQFPKSGGYRVVASIGADATKTYSFRVVDQVIPVPLAS